MTRKLKAGEQFPSIALDTLNHGKLELGKPRSEDTNWQLVVVYRGKHCPLCTKYLAQLNDLHTEFIEAGVDVIVASADPKEKALLQTKENLGLQMPVGIDMSIQQMKELGLYISKPRSEAETDRPFAEPGIFVINDKHSLHVVDISNNPFVRPDLDKLLSGLNWIRDPKNDYPIRGTHPY